MGAKISFRCLCSICANALLTCYFSVLSFKKMIYSAIAFMEGFKTIHAEHKKTLGNLLGLVRHILFVVKRIYFHRRYREMPFPQNAPIYCGCPTPSVT